MPMPRSFPKYPSRDQVVEYLEAYARALEQPPRFGQRVNAIRRDDEGFRIDTQDQVLHAKRVVVATGYTRVPNIPELPGQASRSGALLHSSSYKSGSPWKGKRVLVVGFGNSGGEIAIDLFEHGAEPTLSVRSPVNVIARDILGIPTLAIGIAMGWMPTKLADALAAPLVRAVIGDIERLGLRRLPYGPNAQIREHGRIPLLDIGTIALIREGKIAVRPGIDRLDGDDVLFADGQRESFAAIVLATGYRPALEEIVVDSDAFHDELGTAAASAAQPLPGLFLCGFYVSPSGMLRQIAAEARRIADAIASARRS
jgi:indole-3-pyruvate monooxygenase